MTVLHHQFCIYYARIPDFCTCNTDDFVLFDGRIRPLVVFTSLKVFVVKIYGVIFGSYVLLAEIQAFWRRLSMAQATLR